MKAAVALRKKRNRDRLGQFLVEGHREILRVVETGLDVVEYYICDNLLTNSEARAVAQRLASVNDAVGRQTNEAVFRKLSMRENPEGLLLVVRQFDLSLDKWKADSNGIYLIASGIEKPGNLGSMLRTADAVGSAGAITCDTVTDVFNPNVIRASLGTFATTALASCSREAALSFCRVNEVKIVATSPSAKIPYQDCDMCDAVAVVVGSEKEGLSDYWLENCDSCVMLPSLGAADSINSAMAATVMLFEARRQRDTLNH